MTPRRLYPFLAAGLALMLAGITADVMATHAAGVVAGSELAPYQYRLLFAAVFHPLAALMGDFPAAWLFWTVTLSILALCVDLLCCENGVNDAGQWALLALIMAVLLVYVQPAGGMWSILEAVFYALALLLMLTGRVRWLYPLVMVATLNRETAVFIPVMALLVLRDWKHAAGLGAVWLATYGGIRLGIGPVPLHVTLGEIWAINTGRGLLPFLIGLPLFGWLFWYAARGWRYAPDRLKRAALVIPLYLAAVAVFGVWHEWRLLLPVLPVLVLLIGI